MLIYFFREGLNNIKIFEMTAMAYKAQLEYFE